MGKTSELRSPVLTKQTDTLSSRIYLLTRDQFWRGFQRYDSVIRVDSRNMTVYIKLLLYCENSRHSESNIWISLLHPETCNNRKNHVLFSKNAEAASKHLCSFNFIFKYADISNYYNKVLAIYG